MTRKYTVAQAGQPSAMDSPSSKRSIHQVVRPCGEVVGTFRNKVLADRLASSDPTLTVDSYNL